VNWKKGFAGFIAALWALFPRTVLQPSVFRFAPCNAIENQRPGNIPEFEIIESLPFKKTKGFLYAKDHQRRMRSSASYFGFPFSAQHFSACLNAIQTELRSCPDSYKIRICLDKNGGLRWEKSVLKDEKTLAACSISKSVIDEKNVFLFHKTTHAPWYKDAREKIKNGLVYDEIFCNGMGRITEGSRSNVFIKKKGRLFTPPVAGGLLPGVLRKRLLKTGACTEKIMYPDDLFSADEVLCGNSVRGLVKVMLLSLVS
jgi:branched-subunit amino acid aminotransferase/4-amino-4-deoxychorismate lyase